MNKNVQKKKTFKAKKEDNILKERERALESLCRKSGLCCHIKVGLTDGGYVIHPTLACQYLKSNNLCAVYDKRYMYDAKLCFTREEIFDRDYMLPEGWPYTKFRQGYIPARIVTMAEYETIIVQELERDNYNILLTERIF